MKARFLPAAVVELESAAEDYEAAGPRLGTEFRQEVRSIVTLIERHHRIGPSVNAATKTAPLRLLAQPRRGTDRRIGV